jgi:FAD/FMN-containing dehydrogenase
VRIGPGNRREDVSALLDTLKLSTSGGQVGDVEVGGLIVGSGISFSPRYGWVCDNVLNYVVVLASGEIVNANLTSYVDLTIALRGGSTNFPHRHNIRYEVVPQGDFWAASQ